jgi:hypothetical protein
MVGLDVSVADLFAKNEAVVRDNDAKQQHLSGSIDAVKESDANVEAGIRRLSEQQEFLNQARRHGCLPG